jgi:hypothetical protein
MTKPISFGFYLRIRGYGFSMTTDYPPICRKGKQPLVICGVKFEVHHGQ